MSDYVLPSPLSITTTRICAKDDNTIIIATTNAPARIYEYVLSSATSTLIFTAPEIGSDSFRGIYLTQNNKLIIKVGQKIVQYSYPSGSFEMSASTTGAPADTGVVGGMFSNDGNIHSTSFNVGFTYPILSPYSPRVSYSTYPFTMQGISQIKNYFNVTFIP